MIFIYSCKAHVQLMYSSCTAHIQVQLMYRLCTAHVQPAHVQPAHVQPAHVQIIYSSCTVPGQLMYSSCTAHVQLMYRSCTAHVQLMYSQLMYSQLMYSQLMYSSCTDHVQLMYSLVEGSDAMRYKFFYEGSKEYYRWNTSLKFQIPEIKQLLDDSRMRKTQEERHQTQLMYRRSKKHEERTQILLHNNPISDVSVGNGRILHFMKPSTPEVDEVIFSLLPSLSNFLF